MRQSRFYQSLIALTLFATFATGSLAQQTGSATQATPSLSPTPEPEGLHYKQLRYDEDWSFLRDPSKRTDWWDPIKYIPLNDREDWYLTIGGEARPYYEYYRNQDWGSEPQDDSGYFLQRYMLHADLHMGRRMRLFGQLKSGIEIGRRGGPGPTDEDLLDVHQAFADFYAAPNKSAALMLRAGRQELNFGSGRLITYREGPNVRQSFDGFRLSVKTGQWMIDGFAVKPVETNFGYFDDSGDHRRSFWGVYTVRPLAILSRHGHLDLYYLGLDRKQARFNQGAGREERHTVGARIWNKIEALDYNFEAIWQFGRFGTDILHGRINAWTAASDTGYTLEKVKFRPRLGFKANVTSGDRDPNDPDLQTFNPLFPRGNYFGQLVSIGPLNHIDVHPNLELDLPRDVTFYADWLFYWRQNINDGIYGLPGNLLRPGNQSRKRFIGHQPGIEVSWQINRHTSFTFDYALFYAGSFLKETPPGRNITYFAAWLTYKF
jgi:hypothetical protein